MFENSSKKKQPIEVVDYSIQWPRDFAEEAWRLKPSSKKIVV
jgi:GrpB-like predicted nucleotidyltransferase (UPF0157 family)